MGGDFPHMKAGGTNVRYDTREQRAGRIMYGEDDDPQVVSRGYVETDGAGAIFVVANGRNLRNVAILGAEVSIEMDEDQTAGLYVVQVTSRRQGGAVADVALDYEYADLRRFTVGARRISTGAVIDMSVTVVSFTFSVLRA